MLRKILFWIILMGALALTAMPAQAAKSYHAERYETTLAVQPDGSLWVTETVRFYFGGGPFTYVFRDLTYSDLDQIVDFQAEMDGQVLPQGAQVGQFEVKPADPWKITWRFEPISDSSHEFKLSYRVLGALRQLPGSDSLFWYAIPENHEYPIGQAVVRLEFPAGVSPLNTPVLTGAVEKPESSGAALVWQVGALAADSGLALSADFPSGSLLSAAPLWQQHIQQRQEQEQQARPLGSTVALALGLPGLTALLLFWMRYRRKGYVASKAAPRSTPPDEIAPALVAVLLGRGSAGLATLFDLARRGFLRVEEGKRTWGGRSFQVHVQPITTSLLPHERGFVQALFESGKRFEYSIPLNQVATRLGANSALYIRAVEEELLDLGWLDAERQTRRGQLQSLSLLGLLTGMPLFLIGALAGSSAFSQFDWGLPVGAALMGGGLALSGLGMIGMIGVGVSSSISNTGLHQAAEWRAFAAGLRSAIRSKEPLPVEWFELYLPYTAAFGLAHDWARRFSQQTGTPQPDWFQALQPEDSGGGFIALLAAISAGDSAFTSDSSGGGDGGSSSSGGGSSGAG